MRQSGKTIFCATLISLGVHLLLCLAPLLYDAPATVAASLAPVTVEVVRQPEVEPPNPPPPLLRQQTLSARPPAPARPPRQEVVVPAPARRATLPPLLPAERATAPAAPTAGQPRPTAPAPPPAITLKQPAFMRGAAPTPPRPPPVTQLPTVLEEQRIPYPAQARELGIEGTVRARLLVGPDGTVRKVRVLSGPGFGLNSAAAQALQRFRFQPARDADGSSRAHWITYGYTFRIVD